jgi:S-adenosylmethionine hydrolase
MRGLITLTTDFGTSDEYVGVMKGVILSKNPEAKIIDITHEIEPFNVEQAAIVIERAYKYFPRNTVHIGVVDPGVGGKRKEIIVYAQGHFFVGPDNGIFSFPLKGSKDVMVWEIERERLGIKEISSTFHGRDIFAPSAAILSLGNHPSEIGHPTGEFVIIKELFPVERGEDIVGRVIYFDRFGNAVTNIPNSSVEEGVLEVMGRFLKFFNCYEEWEGVFAIKGSGGFVEISSKMEDVRKLLKIEKGCEVICRKRKR